MKFIDISSETMHIGTDIIEVERIQSLIDKHGDRFLNKVFTHEEQEYCLKHRYYARHFAGRFAAKEAISKALGTGFGKDLAFMDIEIFNDASGKPKVRLKGTERDDIALSISHCKEYATATAFKYCKAT